MTDAIKMQLSAFVDGELSDAESELLIRRIGRDAELRATVAEYHAIGRIMRAEAEPAGMDGLLAAIRDGIDTDEMPASAVPEQETARRMTRPLAGVAIAASVALAGVLGVSQWSPTAAPAAGLADAAYTTPTPDLGLQDLSLLHDQSGTSFNALLTTVELRSRQIETPEESSTSLEDQDEPESAEE